MAYLREQLDDPGLVGDPGWRCDRCDNCGGLALDLEVDAASVSEAAAAIGRPGVPIEPRKLWPTGLSALGLSLSGRINPPAETGRAIARLTDLGHGGALRDLFRVSTGSTTDGGPEKVPDGLARAMVTVLNDWAPEVDGIVVAESASRPALLADLVAGLSRYLQRPVVGTWAVADPSIPPGKGATNSAQRVAAVMRRCALRLDHDVTGRRLLLVDDQVVSGWSMTVAARALHDAGADAVLPLALAISG